MVVETLAATVLSILSPYVAKGAEEFAKEAGKAAFNKVGEILQAIHKKFAGDKEAQDALENFQKKPSRYESLLQEILNEKIEGDHSFKDEIGELLKELGPSLQVVQKMEEGEEITGIDADKMSGGNASVNQDIKKGKKVVGAKIKEIGK